MKKKIGLCIIVCIVAILGAILLPWEQLGNLKNKLLGIEGEYSSLKVYSLGGDMQIFIDGEEKGIVEEASSYLEVFPIEIGEHKVKLVRTESSDGFYEKFERVLKFEKGFDTVISWEIGPSEDSSSGWILYSKKGSSEKDFAYLNLDLSNKEYEVVIDDGEEITDSLYNYELTLDKRHNIKISCEGYQNLEFEILPDEAESREVLKGYKLFLEVNLYKIPI